MLGVTVSLPNLVVRDTSTEKSRPTIERAPHNALRVQAQEESADQAPSPKQVLSAKGQQLFFAGSDSPTSESERKKIRKGNAHQQRQARRNRRRERLKESHERDDLYPVSPGNTTRNSAGIELPSIVKSRSDPTNLGTGHSVSSVGSAKHAAQRIRKSKTHSLDSSCTSNNEDKELQQPIRKLRRRASAPLTFLSRIQGSPPAKKESRELKMFLAMTRLLTAVTRFSFRACFKRWYLATSYSHFREQVCW